MRPPNEDCRSGKVVRVCAVESRRAAGAITGSLTVRSQEKGRRLRGARADRRHLATGQR